MTNRSAGSAMGVLTLLALAGACGGSGSATTPTTPSATTSTPTPSAPMIVLGRPTDRSIAASINLDAGEEVYLEYGPASGSYPSRSSLATGTSSGPVTVRIETLAPDTHYYYRARYRAAGESSYRTDVEHGFQTKRLAGEPFTFVIQADPHMDGNSSAAVYSQTLANELADHPDFMFDLGDTSMAEKCAIDGTTLCAAPSPPTEATVRARYSMMRTYFDKACHSVPLFMVLGNHDGEWGWAGDTGTPSITAWALANRKLLFLNPEPDGSFYSGNTEEVRQNYYAFEWGDVLFVVLDPYTYTAHKPGTDGWGWTLGATQYQWFARTLASSRARFKFVFSHQLLGGNGTDARGGAAFASFFEWGGHDLGGAWTFDTHRPGWAAPIHRLLVDNKVTAWFHGHDHLYAQEQVDGVVYQEVPQPSLAKYDTANPGGDYGYVGKDGVNIFPSSGHLRVTVSATDARVEYVRSVVSADETTTRKNGTVVTSYTIR